MLTNAGRPVGTKRAREAPPRVGARGPLGEPHWIARTNDRAAKIWRAADLPTIMLHEARHTYASFMIAAGVNAKALSTFMGHANIRITLDLYGHMFQARRMKPQDCSTPTCRALSRRGVDRTCRRSTCSAVGSPRWIHYLDFRVMPIRLAEDGAGSGTVAVGVGKIRAPSEGTTCPRLLDLDQRGSRVFRACCAAWSCTGAAAHPSPWKIIRPESVFRLG